MWIEGREKRVFRFKDLNSLISFEDWVKRNLSVYPSKKSVPQSHLIVLLEYLEKQVYDQQVKDKKEWLSKIEALIDRAKKDE